MVNRTALLLMYKEPAIRWINEADPVEESFILTGWFVTEFNTVLIDTVDEPIFDDGY